MGLEKCFLVYFKRRKFAKWISKANLCWAMHWPDSLNIYNILDGRAVIIKKDTRCCW